MSAPRPRPPSQPLATGVPVRSIVLSPMCEATMSVGWDQTVSKIAGPAVLRAAAGWLIARRLTRQTHGALLEGRKHQGHRIGWPMMLDFRLFVPSHSPSPGPSYRLIPDGLSPYAPNWVGFIRARLSMNRTMADSHPVGGGTNEDPWRPRASATGQDETRPVSSPLACQTC